MDRRIFFGALAATTIAMPATLVQGQRKRQNTQVALFKKQMRLSLSIMREGNPLGALVLSNTMNNWAAYVEENELDATIKQLVKKQGRKRGTPNHKEMEELAKELDVGIFGISLHTEPIFDINRVYEDAVNGKNASERMRDAANQVVQMARTWQPKYGTLPIQLFDGSDNYRNCPVCAYAESYHSWAIVVCEAAAAASLVPAAREAAMVACGSAMAAWLALEASCQASRLFGC